MKVHKWTFQEERALTEFIGLVKTNPDYRLSAKEWPSLRHTHQLWTDAALHIKESISSNVLPTSKLQFHFFTLHLFYFLMLFFVCVHAQKVIFRVLKVLL